jgi:hypothetical protein
MWEIDEPAPPPGRGPDEARLARTADRLREYLARTPGLLSMHPYFDDGGLSLLEDDAVVMLEFLGSQPFFGSGGYRARLRRGISPVRALRGRRRPPFAGA